MLVSKRMCFDAAHFLPKYEGKCSKLHGHRWVVEVGCSGRVNKETGMVVDFKDLKDFLQTIEDRFDHKLLNDVIENPTAENICKYIFDWFILWCTARELEFKFVRVWETDDSMVELS